MSDHGKIQIKLEKLISESDLSKNKVCQRAEMQMTQLNKYYNNTITRLDTDVLARLCTVLNCKIEDLIEFIPSTED
ncbi:MAG: helix-turn-helix transcriptional regulator [Clostridia bacterium]|nr:helix-turn-helix transcriptional regulator [Clostridia bacterium]